MKKIIYCIIILFVCSCNLEKLPSGTISSKGGVKSVEHVGKLRNNLYVLLRALYSGEPIYINEIKADIFNASIGYGNRLGSTYRWEWISSDDVASTMWHTCYYINSQANYILQSIENISEQENLTDKEKYSLSVYKGEAYFVKAAAMFELAQRFCKVYEKSSASREYGVILTDEYNPSADETTYGGRSTLEETYLDIVKKLELAASLLENEVGKIASMYLTIDAVTAMQARVALTMGDYKLAAQKASLLVDEGKYKLIGDSTNFSNLWIKDSGEECIMQLDADYAKESLPRTMSYNYISEDAEGNFSPDYIPQQWIIDLYSTTDLRYNTWFKNSILSYGAIKGEAVIFAKFPGNRSLQSEKKQSDYIHKIKLFRIAEQYLIAAEAYAMMGGNDKKAISYLDTLRIKRDKDYVDQPFTSNILKSEIKKERIKELIGEGFRILDIKRYKEGFTRKVCQNKNIVWDPTNELSALLSVEADNGKFLWPIPQAEIDANPQIKDQQNYGY